MGTEAGLRYRLEDGSEHKSPSSAGSAVMGGTACNGWKFWSLEGQEKVKNAADSDDPANKPKRRSKKAKAEDTERIGCGSCDETFASSEEATEHLVTAHPAEEPETDQ